MILSLGLGEPSYVPDSFLGKARDCADVNSVAFLQCYARDSVQWGILCFFAVYQEEWCSLATIAEETDDPVNVLAARLADMAETRLLEQRILVTGPLYRLTQDPELKRAAVRAGLQWRAMPDYSD